MSMSEELIKNQEESIEEFLNDQAREVLGQDTGLGYIEKRLLHFCLAAVLLCAALILLFIKVYSDGLSEFRAELVHLGALTGWSLVLVGYALYSLLRFNRDTKTKLARRVFLDELTEVFNFRYLDSRLAQEEARVNRYGGCTSVLYLDLDHFKQVNDRYGHGPGNRVLCEIRDVLMGRLREADVLGRWGGDEFLAILPHTPRAGARVGAERMRALVEEQSIALRDGKTVDFVTVSIGVASYPDDGETMRDVVNVADRGVYHAKGQGGNMVCSDTGGHGQQDCRPSTRAST
jgi:diguanylate cyclase (GGDEF)-like protein